MNYESAKNTVKGVSKAGYVIFLIGKIASIIGAVALIVSILFLSFLPTSAFCVEISVGTRVLLEKSILGSLVEDGESFEILQNAGEAEDLLVEKTEDGIAFTAQPMKADLTNRTVAVALLPMLVELCVVAGFCHMLARAFRSMSESPLLFSREAAADLKLAGIWMWVRFGAPMIVSSLVQIMTGLSLGGEDPSLILIFWGFALRAIALLLEYGADAEERAFATF